MGMYASEATGFVGDSTKSGLITVPDQLPGNVTTARHYVRAIVFTLLANGYDLTINSYWSQETAAAVAQFQRDMALPETGKVDVTTWMALLVSYGDKNRPYTACDTRFEITDDRLSTLKTMGIQAVGRYINGTEFKILRDGEVERIINGGLGLIPIYQENGTSASDFSEVIGRSQAIKANENAKKFGIPYDSIIYFAVDYDAQDWEISEYIIPYFKGVSEALTNYRIGVYGTRNVCSQVTSVRYAVTSYVSNMSSGFSGNLGFKMPDNWNFDQFDEIKISDWGIDKVVHSGLYPPVDYFVQSVSDYEFRIQHNEAVINQMLRVLQVLSASSLDNPWNPHLSFYRYESYLGIEWDILASPVSTRDREIFDDLKNTLKQEEGLYSYFLDPKSGTEIGLAHLIVTLQSHLFITQTIHSNITDFTGWAGDLITAWGQLLPFKPNISIEEGIYILVGGNDESMFPFVDLLQDVDAYNIAQIAKTFDDSTAISSLKKYYVLGSFEGRLNKFITGRFGSIESIYAQTLELFTNDDDLDLIEEGILTFFVASKVENASVIDLLDDAEWIARGFSNKLKYFISQGI